MIAVMENYQQADGTIIVPEVLQKYVGAKVIK
jgi:seryl-tRNA synthetase